MARIQPVDPEKIQGKSKEILDAIKAKSGRVPNILKTMIHSPAAVQAYLGMSGALAGCVLPPKVRELLAVAVAEDNQCHYCLAAHSAIGKSLGLTTEELQAGRLGVSPDPKMNALLKFAAGLSKNRGNVTDKEFEAVRKAGATDEEIIEVIALVGLNLFTNYFNHVADPAIDFPQIPPLR